MAHPDEWRHRLAVKGLNFVLCLVSLLLLSDDVAADRKCNKLKKAQIIGILSEQQYLQVDLSVEVFKRSKKAQRQGYSAFTPCTSSQGKAVSLRAAKRCKLAFGIKEDLRYLTASQVKRFSSEEAALNAGYLPYNSCQEDEDPSPTPTPAPAGPSFELEDGVRHDDIANSDTIRLPDDTYVAYLGISYNSIEQKTLARATSMDGLSWSAPQEISGIVNGPSETFTRPSVLHTGGTSFSIVYQSIRHISSGGVDFYNLEGAVTDDGTNFSEQPSGNFLNVGQTDSPSLLIVGDTWRLYYMQFGDLRLALSEDEGQSWTIQEGEIPIYGSSDDFAPYPYDPEIVRTGDDRYRMYFASPPNTEDLKYSIFSAVSDDGLSFTIEQDAVLSPADPSESYIGPDLVELPNGDLRLYFSRITSLDQGGFKYEILSALSPSLP